LNPSVVSAGSESDGRTTGSSDREYLDSQHQFESERRTREIVEEAAEGMIGVSDGNGGGSEGTKFRKNKRRKQEMTKKQELLKRQHQELKRGRKKEGEEQKRIRIDMETRVGPTSWINTSSGEDGNVTTSSDSPPASTTDNKQLVFEVLSEEIFHMDDSQHHSSLHNGAHNTVIDNIGDVVVTEWGGSRVMTFDRSLASPIYRLEALNN